MDHPHDQPHRHHDTKQLNLFWPVVLTLGYAVVEAGGGWLTHSLALLSDAGHMFSDSASLGLAWLASWIALIGLLVNVAVAWHLQKGQDNLNAPAALLHVMGDLLGSVAAIAAGAVIYFTGWTRIDPILSMLISFLILTSTFNLLREMLNERYGINHVTLQRETEQWLAERGA